MKTTNYELSKKLAEIGFDAKSDFYYFNKGTLLDYCNNLDEIEYSKPITKSYDLETILEALPAYIEHINTEYHFWLWNDGMGYYPNYDKYSGEAVYDMDNGIFEFSENESLADTAARLWLKLKKENLI